MNNVPKDPGWCSRCITSSEGPCKDHAGPDGKPTEYAGYDAYEPSEWVTHVVGKSYSGWDHGTDGSNSARKWTCFGYDPRSGFWMRTADDLGPERTTNISERAIGRTFHEIWEPSA